MLQRPILPIFFFSMLLGACSYFGGDDGMPSTTAIDTAMPAADLPTYGKGDRYTYNNPKETWTVVSIANDLVQWESSLGDSQVTVFDPLMAPIEWTLDVNSKATRKFLEWDRSMFPLRTGRKMTVKEVVRLGQDAGPTHFEWTCYAGGPEEIRVPAGKFATYPVHCERDDGFQAKGYYAPAVNKVVSIIYTEPNGRTDVRNLQSYTLGKGTRIAAREQRLVPRGWSVAAVDSAYARSLASKPAASDGRYLVQLSSVTSAKSARNEWSRIKKAHSNLLGEKSLVLEKREIAGRGTFYRVQTGRYKSLKDARAVCASLKAQKQGCLAIKR